MFLVPSLNHTFHLDGKYVAPQPGSLMENILDTGKVIQYEKTNNLGFRPGSTQTGLNSHRSRLEACHFRFKKKDCTISVAKTEVLISCAVTAQLICLFIFAHAISITAEPLSFVYKWVCHPFLFHSLILAEL